MTEYELSGHKEAEFLSWEQAENRAAKVLQEMADKMIIDDVRKQNVFQLGILKEPAPLVFKDTHDMFYDVYGIQVFDPTKVYIIRPTFEERLPWYKRLLNWFVKCTKHGS